jgi:hypothetical protein
LANSSSVVNFSQPLFSLLSNQISLIANPKKDISAKIIEQAADCLGHLGPVSGGQLHFQPFRLALADKLLDGFDLNDGKSVSLLSLFSGLFLFRQAQMVVIEPLALRQMIPGC